MFGGDTPLRSITALQVSEAIEALAKTKARTAQAAKSFLRESLREAVVHGWLDANPVRDIGNVKVEVQRSRLTFETFMAVYRATDLVWLRNSMALALVTAQRREDIALARFADFREDAWWVIQGKTGSKIRIPTELRLEVFGMSLDEVVRQCRMTGVLSKHLVHQTDPHSNPFHEIRSLSERLYSAQGNVNTQHLLGHKDAKTTALYHGSRADWVKLDIGRIVER